MVKTIEKEAFYNCTNLRGVILPLSITNINESAFNGCSKYKNTYYMGKAADWANVTVTANGNDYFTKATVNYSAINLYNYNQSLQLR